MAYLSYTNLHLHEQAVEKEQESRCCIADVCLHESVNQLYNNQKMAKRVLFPLLVHEVNSAKEDINLTFQD